LKKRQHCRISVSGLERPPTPPNFGKSPIQGFADVLLFTMARETSFRTEAMTSRLAQLAIIDVLIACLALTDYDKSVETNRHTFDILSFKRY
jgi:RpiR family carbohydrate utilization transcriptional regulator